MRENGIYKSMLKLCVFHRFEFFGFFSDLLFDFGVLDARSKVGLQCAKLSNFDRVVFWTSCPYECAMPYYS